jgi:hypothetical protein
LDIVRKCNLPLNLRNLRERIVRKTRCCATLASARAVCSLSIAILGERALRRAGSASLRARLHEVEKVQCSNETEAFYTGHGQLRANVLNVAVSLLPLWLRDLCRPVR